MDNDLMSEFLDGSRGAGLKGRPSSKYSQFPIEKTKSIVLDSDAVDP
jgi:hypothetical protein